MTEINREIKAIAVFCGSNNGLSPEYIEQAKELGNAFIKNGYELIYGGGSTGIMGVIAKIVHDGGGKVLGIMPDPLYSVSGDPIGEVVLVPDMHTRKSMMNDKSDAFIALPGGFGTLEELMEVTAWSQLNIHSKPVLVLNTNGFYDPLVVWIKRAVQEGFIREDLSTILRPYATVPEVIEALQTYRAPGGRFGLVWKRAGEGVVIPEKEPREVI